MPKYWNNDRTYRQADPTTGDDKIPAAEPAPRFLWGGHLRSESGRQPESSFNYVINDDKLSY